MASPNSSPRDGRTTLSDKSNKSPRDSVKEGSDQQDGELSDAVSTEDDPLSDVWDSADEEGEHVKSDKLPKVAEHTLVNIPTSKGNQQIDITPPETLLNEAEIKRQHYYRKRMADECIKEAMRCFALTRIVTSDKDALKLAQCHVWIAKAYWELKEYAEQTQQHAEDALRQIAQVTSGGGQKNTAEQKNLPANQHIEIWHTALEAHYLLARALLAQKKHSASEYQFQRAMRSLEELKAGGAVKDKNFWKTEIYTGLSRVALSQQRYDPAISYLKNVVRLMERRYGQNSGKLVPVYLEMASISHKKNASASEELDEAIEFATQAYNIAKENEKMQEQLANAAFKLATLHSSAKSDDSEIYVESYLHEAISCYEDSLGPANTKTIRAQQLLAKHLADHDRPQEATAILEQCMKASIPDAYGEYSTHAACAYRSLASYALQSGNLAEGVQHLKKCLAIQSFIYGKNNSRTEATQKALTVLLQNPSMEHLHENKALEARPYFKNVVKTSIQPGTRKL